MYEIPKSIMKEQIWNHQANIQHADLSHTTAQKTYAFTLVPMPVPNLNIRQRRLMWQGGIEGAELLSWTKIDPNSGISDWKIYRIPYLSMHQLKNVY